MAKKDEEVEVKEAIAPLALDFHREDLNLLRDKLNEVIASL